MNGWLKNSKPQEIEKPLSKEWGFFFTTLLPYPFLFLEVFDRLSPRDFMAQSTPFRNDFQACSATLSVTFVGFKPISSRIASGPLSKVITNIGFKSNHGTGSGLISGLPTHGSILGIKLGLSSKRGISILSFAH